MALRKKANKLQDALTQTSSKESVGRRLINVEEAAQYLGIEVITVYKKSRLREIPSVKIGRALRFDVKALDRYIEQNTIEAIDWKGNVRVY